MAKASLSLCSGEASRKLPVITKHLLPAGFMLGTFTWVWLSTLTTTSFAFIFLSLDEEDRANTSLRIIAFDRQFSCLAELQMAAGRAHTQSSQAQQSIRTAGPPP